MPPPSQTQPWWLCAPKEKQDFKDREVTWIALQLYGAVSAGGGYLTYLKKIDRLEEPRPTAEDVVLNAVLSMVVESWSLALCRNGAKSSRIPAELLVFQMVARMIVKGNHCLKHALRNVQKGWRQLQVWAPKDVQPLFHGCVRADLVLPYLIDVLCSDSITTHDSNSTQTAGAHTGLPCTSLEVEGIVKWLWTSGIPSSSRQDQQLGCDVSCAATTWEKSGLGSTGSKRPRKYDEQESEQALERNKILGQ